MYFINVRCLVHEFEKITKTKNKFIQLSKLIKIQ